MALSRLDFETIERDLAVLRRMKAEIQGTNSVLARLQHAAMLQRNSKINAELARRVEKTRAGASQRNALDLRDHDRHRVHDLERGGGFDPNQPRVPAGHADGGQWTRVAGPITALPTRELFAATEVQRRGGPLRGRYDEPSFPLIWRLVAANRRFDDALRRINDPDWKPSTASWSYTYEGMVLHAEARAREAEVKARGGEFNRLGRGGNYPPPSLQFGTGAPAFRSLDAPQYIEAYRALQSWPDMLGRETRAVNEGTVAVTQVGDLVRFGVNSEAATYTDLDRSDANRMRDILLRNHPDVMDTVKIGSIKNQAPFHAEATALLRVARETGGTLAGRTIEVQVDRAMCRYTCRDVLPRIGLELGNPMVTFVNWRTGERRTMWNGRWM